MAHFKVREQKIADGDVRVTLMQDASGGWFVGCDQSPETHPTPLGAFITREAARSWADRHHPGGEWAR
jgi:hypothetical protein